MKKNTTNNKTIRIDQKFSVSKATDAKFAIGSTKTTNAHEKTSMSNYGNAYNEGEINK